MKPREAAAEDPARMRGLPPDLPVPEDDGAADHLPGLKLPAIVLPSTGDGEVDLALCAKGTMVLYVYPQTGVPGRPSPPGWDQIPGARGCTPESCGFRDHAAELAALGASVLGLSSQAAGEQREFAAREHAVSLIERPVVAARRGALRLPTFEVAGRRYYRRLTLVAPADDRQGVLSGLPAGCARSGGGRLASSSPLRRSTAPFACA